MIQEQVRNTKIISRGGGARDAIYLFAPACGGRLLEY